MENFRMPLLIPQRVSFARLWTTLWRTSVEDWAAVSPSKLCQYGPQTESSAMGGFGACRYFQDTTTADGEGYCELCARLSVTYRGDRP
jgi:hypothetical protein